MNEARYERKFTVNDLSRRQLEARILGHPALFSELYPPRWVNNVYLDSPDLGAVRETLDGISRRDKLRIRWYGPLWPADGLRVERKMKQGTVGGKSVWPVAGSSNTSALRITDVRHALENADIPEAVRLRFVRHRPVLVNRYARSYYGSSDGRFRITIDSGMCYHAFQPLGGDLLQWSHQRRLLVLELKYERQDDEAARWITQRLPLRVSRNSKYVTGMSLVYPYIHL